jgi:hypothetical protein
MTVRQFPFANTLYKLCSTSKQMPAIVVVFVERAEADSQSRCNWLPDFSLYKIPKWKKYTTRLLNTPNDYKIFLN